MRKFPVIGILKTGEHVTDLEHPLFNTFSLAILQCNSKLNEVLSADETSTIYVHEDSETASVKLPDGTRATFG